VEAAFLSPVTRFRSKEDRLLSATRGDFDGSGCALGTTEHDAAGDDTSAAPLVHVIGDVFFAGVDRDTSESTLDEREVARR